MLNITRKYLLIFVFFTFIFANYSLPAQGATQEPFTVRLPSSVYNGQPFLLEVTALGLEKLALSWEGKILNVPVDLQKNTETAYSILPVGLDAKQGTKTLDITMTINGRPMHITRDIVVQKKKYPVQKLTVSSKFVDLNEKDMARQAREKKDVNAVIGKITPVRMWTLPLTRPVPGEVSSLFGVTRMFNGKPRSSHKGLDFKALEGDDIKATARGTVVLARNHFFSGNVVYIDHGLGVFTAYAHMSEILVKEGEEVKAGEVIGKIGSTGRVTAPHLHLSALVLGTSVDPEILLALRPAGAVQQDELTNNAGNTGTTR